MTESFKIRKVNEKNRSELDQIMSLHNDNWQDNRVADQWLWEFTSNYPERFVFTVVDDEGKIVGTQGMVPIYLNIAGKKSFTGKSEATLLNKDYRGKDLFQKMYAHALKDCGKKKMKCIWGYTNKSLAKGGFRNKLGFEAYDDILFETVMLFDVKVLISELKESTRPGWKKAAKRLRLYNLNMRTRSTLGTSPKLKADTDYKIKSRVDGADDIAELYERIRIRYPELIHIAQDNEYLNWRLYNNPNVDYTTLFVYDKNKLIGYCYYSISKNRAYFSDFTFENENAGIYLILHIFKKLRTENVGQMSFVGNVKNPLTMETFDLLEKFGFMMRKQGAGEALVLKNLTVKNKSHLLDVKNWYLNRLWTEGYSY
jgi:GNAT superfamily N-acetyltransferase